MPGFFTSHPYPYKHWLVSLAAAPLFLALESAFVQGFNFNQLAELYVVFIAFSLVLSLPVFILYLLAFKVLYRQMRQAVLLKLVLDLIGVCGVYATFMVIDGSLNDSLAIAYAAALVLTSFFLKMGPERIQEE